MYSNLSLKYKLLAPMIFFGILLFIVLSFVAEKMVTLLVSQEIEKKTKTIAHAVDQFALISGKSSDLPRLISMLGGDRDIKDITIAAGEPFEIIVDTDKSLIGKGLNDNRNKDFIFEHLFNVFSNNQYVFDFNKDDEIARFFSTIRIREPNSIKDEKGLLFISVDTKEELILINNQVKIIEGIIFIGWLFIMILSYTLNFKMVFEPISSIILAIKKRAKGENCVAEIYSNDEIGQVAENYNELLDKIVSSEKKWFAIVDNIAEGVMTVNDDGEILSINNSFQNIFGYSESEIINENISKIVKVKDFKNIKDFQEILAVKKNGEIFDVEIGVAEIKYEDDIIFIVSIKDISLRKKIEAKIKESEQRYELAVSGSSDGIWDWDIKTDYMYFSPRFKQMLGYEGDEFPNTFSSFENALHSSDKNLVIKALKLHIQDNIDFNMTFRMKTKEEKFFWFRGRGIALRNNQGVAIRMAGSLSDINELIKAKENAEVQKEKAIIASKAKGDFLAAVTHEIRTPLNGIIGVAQLMRDYELSVEQMKLLETLEYSSDSLLAVINDVLDFSKIESGKIDLYYSVFDLEEVCCDVIRGFSTKNKKENKNIELYVDYDLNIPRKINSDFTKLRQIILNFINNAFKFTKTGSITIGVKQKEKDLIISVIDTGIGIPFDKKDRLFKEFSQVDSSTTRNYGGTGLGLSICKKISEAFGGKVGCDSVEGKGSAFWVKLPNPFSEEQYVFEQCLQSKKVLVITESEKNLNFLEKAIKHFGGELLSLSSLNEFDEKKIDYKEFDFYILDGSKISLNDVFLKESNIFDKQKTILFSTFFVKNDFVSKLGKENILLIPISIGELYKSFNYLLGMGKGNDVKEESVQKNELRDCSDKSVLLVDDVKINRQIANALLSKYKFNITEAKDGLEAVEFCDMNKFDIIFMDCLMPNMDGFTASYNIRKSELNKDTPIIALTANALSDTKDKCIKSGMNDFMSKPFKHKKLMELLFKWLNIQD